MTTPRRIIIVGGVAAGMSVATRLRRLDEHAQITVLERGEHVSFANCGLAYHVGGVIPRREDLLLNSPERLTARFRLEVRTRSEVTSIDPDRQTVTVNGETLPYDDLVIATGAAPIVPEIPGHERLLLLRSIEDMDLITDAVDALPPDSPIVIAGAGYVGIELAENLTHRGFQVTLVQRGDTVLALDPELSSVVEDHLTQSGVTLQMGTTLTAVHDATVDLDNATTLPAALVISAIGVRPESDIAAAAGVRTGPSGAIVVDSEQRTSVDHIWAVGDVALKISAIDGSPRPVALAGPANRDGRYLADALVSTDRSLAPRPSFATAIIEIFGVTVASFGASERSLSGTQRRVRIIHTHPTSHATYYPGAEGMSIKLVVDAETDLILGAQIAGGSGVDKRIDVLLTAASAGLTASALANLELAYAPQFGSAKDPINMLGYIALNLRDGVSRTIQWSELDREIAAGATLVDVRSAEEFSAGAIPGSVNMPLDELRDRAQQLPGGRVVVHCQVGQRGHTAARLLNQLGFDAVNLDGGFRTWLAGNRSRQPQPLGAP